MTAAGVTQERIDEVRRDLARAGLRSSELTDEKIAADLEAADARQAAATSPQARLFATQQALDLKVQELWLARVARRIVDEIQAQADPAMPFDVGTLAEILAREPEPPHRAEGLIPSEAGTLIVAQRKTGKTTLTLNLARCLIDGRPLLGRFPVRPVEGTVALLNYEVAASTAARWADGHGVDRDRLVIVNLRGRRNPLDHPADRERLAELLREHNTETLVVDPFGRAYGGKSQNDSGEVGAWLIQLDQFARTEVGALDLVLTAHAGWDGERTRGASALEDWADAIITLVRDRDDETQRYLRATGRDVDVEEDRLAFDPDTRTLTLTGAGSRKAATAAAKLETLATAVGDAVRRSPGLNVTALVEALRAAGHGLQRGDAGRAAERAVQRGLVRVEHGSRNAKHYFPAELSPAIPNLPGGSVASYPEPVLKDGIARRDNSAQSYPAADAISGPCASCSQVFAGRYGSGGSPLCTACRGTR